MKELQHVSLKKAKGLLTKRKKRYNKNKYNENVYIDCLHVK